MLPPIYTTLQASATVRSLLGNKPRVYRNEAPQKVEAPYAVWLVVAGTPENNLSDTPSHDRATVQVDVYAAGDGVCEAVAQAIRDQMETVTHMTAWRTLPRDAETRNFRISMDFDFWLAREA